jgi:hypothetical protein
MTLPTLLNGARALADGLITLSSPPAARPRGRAPVAARRSNGARRGVRVCASGEDRGALGKALDLADSAAETVAGLVPASVAPRPVVKTGVLVAGGFAALSIVSKLISTAVFVGLVGAGGWLLYQANQEDGGGGGGGGGKRKGGGSAADALAEARRLMDKYK